MSGAKESKRRMSVIAMAAEGEQFLVILWSITVIYASSEGIVWWVCSCIICINDSGLYTENVNW